MMKQEDILRELELLPVWQSRMVETETQIETKVEQLKPETVEVAPAPVSETVLVAPIDTFRCVLSQDAQWLFLLAPQQTVDADTLFQNILKALRVSAGEDVEQANLVMLSQFAPKLMVVMGEEVAQQLLTTANPLAQLRGKPQILNDIPIVVTYALADLLQNQALKAKAWADLCLAKNLLAS